MAEKTEQKDAGASSLAGKGGRKRSADDQFEHDLITREAEARARTAELCASNEPPKSVASRPVEDKRLLKASEQSEDPNDNNLLRHEIKGHTTEHADPPRLADEGQSGG